MVLSCKTMNILYISLTCLISVSFITIEMKLGLHSLQCFAILIKHYDEDLYNKYLSYIIIQTRSNNIYQ